MGLLSRLNDSLNPILVREVRQSLRSRVFTGSFISLLVLAVALTLGLLGTHFDDRFGDPGPFGPVLFQAMVGCFELALLGAVPLGAFMAMSEEWNAGTWEQLSLSGLVPARIVRGRLLASMVQAVLYSSALVPFLAASFLLHGLDLTVVLIALGWILCWSPCLTMLAIAMGSFGGPRMVRALLMIALVGILFGAGSLVWAVVDEVASNSSYVHTVEAKWFLLFFSMLGALVFLYGRGIACALLTHPEENRSTYMRIVTTVVMAMGVGVIAWVYADNPNSSPPYFIATGGLFAFWIPAALFATEPERLSNRVASRVPKNRFLALLAVPFLPGGGRGYVFLLLVSTVYAAACAAIFYYMPARSTALPRMGYGVISAALLSVVVFTGFPSGLYCFFTRNRIARLAAFASVVAVAALGTFVHLSFLYRLDESSPWMLTNPFALSAFYWGTSWSGREELLPHFEIMLGLALLAALLNAPRMILGVREVLLASAAARKRAASLRGS